MADDSTKTRPPSHPHFTTNRLLWETSWNIFKHLFMPKTTTTVCYSSYFELREDWVASNHIYASGYWPFQNSWRDWGRIEILIKLKTWPSNNKDHSLIASFQCVWLKIDKVLIFGKSKITENIWQYAGLEERVPKHCYFGDALFKSHIHSLKINFTFKKNHYSVGIHSYTLKLGNSTNLAMVFIEPAISQYISILNLTVYFCIYTSQYIHYIPCVYPLYITYYMLVHTHCVTCI